MTNTTTRAHRPTVPATPIEVTTSYPRLNPRTGARASRGFEIWSARSVDGQWTYERSEEPGTPWIVRHLSTGHEEFFASLPKARHWTASDRALSDIRRVMLAQVAEAHAAERTYGRKVVFDGQICTATELERKVVRRLATLTALAVLAA
jgi:hypothetical protein